MAPDRGDDLLRHACIPQRDEVLGRHDNGIGRAVDHGNDPVGRRAGPLGRQDGADGQLGRACRHRAERQQSHTEKSAKGCAFHGTPSFPSIHLKSSPLAPRREAHFLPGSNAPKQVESTLLRLGADGLTLRRSRKKGESHEHYHANRRNRRVGHSVWRWRLLLAQGALSRSPRSRPQLPRRSRLCPLSNGEAHLATRLCDHHFQPHRGRHPGLDLRRSHLH
jgi:hypothetical protein